MRHARRTDAGVAAKRRDAGRSPSGAAARKTIQLGSCSFRKCPGFAFRGVGERWLRGSVDSNVARPEGSSPKAETASQPGPQRAKSKKIEAGILRPAAVQFLPRDSDAVFQCARLESAAQRFHSSESP